jgi:hypothetical protein
MSVESTEVIKAVPIADWGKDHWSLLGYLMTRAADFKVPTPIGLSGGGVFSVDRKHLRANEKTHPLLVASDPMGGCRSAGGPWGPENGTRLRGYWKDDNSKDESRKLATHDDWDCIDDLEADGLIETISLVNGYIRMTKRGASLGSRLMKHKAQGGHFATFDVTKDARGRKARGAKAASSESRGV